MIKNLFFFIFFIISDNLYAQIINLPQTGQINCYDASGKIISCDMIGQDGELVKGFAWGESRFVDNKNGTLTDLLTGLIWLKNANCFGWITSWEQALNLSNTLNSGECGLTDGSKEGDWRLPNINELASLNHAGAPAISVYLNTHGFNNVQGYDYWSSTTYEKDTRGAYVASLWSMDIYAYEKNFYDINYPVFVLPIRDYSSPSYPVELAKTGQINCYNGAGQIIDCLKTGQDGEYQTGKAFDSTRFQLFYCDLKGICPEQSIDCDNDSKNDIVRDSFTNLIWTRTANFFPLKSWENALISANNLNLCGFNDWRLPNRTEMYSLTYKKSLNPESKSIPLPYPFIDLQNYYWTSTTYSYTPSSAWGVNIWDSTIYAVGIDKSQTYNAWPVRGGLNGAFYYIDIIRSGVGMGNILAIPDSIVCVQNCSGQFNANTLLALTAVPDNYSIFNKWEGDCIACAKNSKCNLSMDKNKNCIAVFAKAPAKNILACDLNGDTQDEIIMTDSLGNIFYSSNLISWTSVSGKLEKEVACGDINNDGKADIAGISQYGEIYYSLDLGSNWEKISGNLEKLILSDINGDKRADFIGLDSSGHIYISDNLINWNNISGNLKVLIAADLSATKPGYELAGLSNSGEIYLTTDLKSWIPASGNLNFLLSCDLDGDKYYNDFIGINLSENIYYSINFSNWQAISGNLLNLTIADFDGDGSKNDIIGINKDNYIFFLKDLGNSWTQVQGLATRLITGDLNSDNKSDIIAIGLDGYVWYSYNLGVSWNKINY